jgi:hypothetical protein
MIATTVTLCLFAPALVPQEPQPTPLLITRPVRALMGVREPILPPHVWSFLRADDSDWETRDHLLSVPESGAVLDPDSIIGLVKGCEPELFDVEDGAFIDQIESGKLVFGGDSAVVRRALVNLARLEALVARPIEVRASLYAWRREAPAQVILNAEELAELTGGEQPIWTGRARSRPGVAVQLGHQRQSRYVRRAEVHVAEEAKIGYPVVAGLFEGVSLVVEPHAMIGSDDMVVFCQLAIGRQRREIATVRHGLPDVPPVEAPELDVDAAAMSGKIRNGGALVYCASSPEWAGSNLLLTVRARYSTKRAEAPKDTRVLPVSALSTVSLGHSVEFGTWDDSPGGDRIRPASLSEDALLFIDDGQLMDLVRNHVDPAAWDERASMQWIGGFLFLSGERGTLEAAEKLVVQLERRWIKNAEVRLETLAQPADSRDDAFARPRRDAPVDVLHRVVFPALADRAHVVVHGVETSGVGSVAAEIAARAAILEPQVDELFSGIGAAVEPYRDASGLCARVQIRIGQEWPARLRNLGEEVGGNLSLRETSVGRFGHDGLLPAQGALDLGLGPAVRNESRVWRTRQTIRIVAR